MKQRYNNKINEMQRDKELKESMNECDPPSTATSTPMSIP
jgi:hypothetical protein